MKAPMAAANNTQRMQALRRANEIRVARAALKQQIATGRTSAADAILSGAAEVERMTVIELLMSQRSWGLARCHGLLGAVALPENKTIGSMTDRQRGLLAAMLGRQAGCRAVEVDAAARQTR